MVGPTLFTPVHAKHDNIGTEKTRGGSHGVGKIANNAASDIHLMYFANCDKYGNQHLGGSVQLFDHQIDSRAYRGTGHYVSVNDTHTFVPYRNDHTNPVFQKKNRGLKIIIPYLRNELNDKEGLVKAICNNFFVSILDEKLEVTLTINEKALRITRETFDDILRDYYPTDVAEMKNDFLPLYVHTYINADPMAIGVVLPKKYNSQTFNFKLFYSDDNELIPTGRTAIVRSMGMKIEDRKVTSHVRTPYNAVLIGGPEEDEYLKSLENESHTALSNEQIRDPEKKKKASAFLSRLNTQLKKVIEESQSEKYETDGQIDTSDLIYEMNWEFDKHINGNSEKIELNNGRNVVIDNKKEKRDRNKNKGDGGGSGEETKRKRKPRKQRLDLETEQEVIKYILPPAVVNRAIIGLEEYISFRFNDIEGARHWKTINLGLKLVNGQGDEIDEGVSLTDLYTTIDEMNSGQSDIRFDDKKVYNVPVLFMAI